MQKHKKLSETLKKTIIQETVGNNFVSFLKNSESTRDTRAILNLMIKKLITERGVPYISIEDYITFFKKIPLKLYFTLDMKGGMLLVFLVREFIRLH